MKKSIFIFSIIILFLLSFSTLANASSSIVSLSSDKKKISPGEEFIVDVEMSNDSLTFKGVEFTIDYNKDIFDLKKVELDDSSNYALFNNSPECIDILTVQGNKTPLIAHVTLTAKENIKSNNCVITLSNISIGFLDNDELEKMDNINLNIKVGNGTNHLYVIYIIAGIAIISTLIYISIIKFKKIN